MSISQISREPSEVVVSSQNMPRQSQENNRAGFSGGTKAEWATQKPTGTHHR